MRLRHHYRFLIITILFLHLNLSYGTIVDTRLSTIAPIISRNNCLGCHSSPTNTNIVHASTLGWINSGLIIRGDSTNSRLVKALTVGTKPAAMSGVSVSAADLTSIKTWIDQVQITCPQSNSNINTAKFDGCSCNANFDETRNSLGVLTQCLPHQTIVCTVTYSQVNTSKPGNCGCIPGYNETRNTLQVLTACTQPTFVFNPELKRYNRCHGQFTRSSIGLNDPRVPLILVL